MHTLVLLRHGQSTWNLENRFTGWTDVDLTPQGRARGRDGGAPAAPRAATTFDVAHTSVLKRAIRTLWIVLDRMDRMWIPVQRDWRLNERHYGALQGLNKAETAARYGEEQVHAVAHGATTSARRALARRRSAPPGTRPRATPRSIPDDAAADGVARGHGRALPALLARARSPRRSAPASAC